MKPVVPTCAEPEIESEYLGPEIREFLTMRVPSQEHSAAQIERQKGEPHCQLREKVAELNKARSKGSRASTEWCLRLRARGAETNQFVRRQRLEAGLASQEQSQTLLRSPTLSFGFPFLQTTKLAPLQLLVIEQSQRRG